MALTTTAIIVGAAAIIGAGVSAYGQYQQGQTQNAIQQFNAQQQEMNARMQADAMRSQAELQRSQAMANFNLRQTEAQARINNAKRMEQNVAAQDAIDRQNLRDRRDRMAEQLATRRAQYAHSGVVESSGTPLDVLARIGGEIQKDQERAFFSADARRRTLLNEAAFERLGGKLALRGATLDRNSAVAEAALREVGASSAYASGLADAEISRLTGSAAKKAGTYQAGATLLSGLTGAASGIASSSTPTYRTS